MLESFTGVLEALVVLYLLLHISSFKEVWLERSLFLLFAV